MAERNGIKLIEYDDASFRKLQTSEKLILLADAEQTNYENKMKLERQLARIQKLQYETNEKRISELESQEPVREPINVTFVPDKEKERRKREDEARSRAREIEIDMARGITVSKSQLQKQQSVKLRRFQK